MSQIHHSLHSTGTGAGFDDGVTMWAVGDELAVVVVWDGVTMWVIGDELAVVVVWDGVTMWVVGDELAVVVVWESGDGDGRVLCHLNHSLNGTKLSQTAHTVQLQVPVDVQYQPGCQEVQWPVWLRALPYRCSSVRVCSLKRCFCLVFWHGHSPYMSEFTNRYFVKPKMSGYWKSPQNRIRKQDDDHTDSAWLLTWYFKVMMEGETSLWCVCYPVLCDGSKTCITADNFSWNTRQTHIVIHSRIE